VAPQNVRRRVCRSDGGVHRPSAARSPGRDRAAARASSPASPCRARHACGRRCSRPRTREAGGWRGTCPGLRGRLEPSRHDARHGGLADDEAEFEQLTVDARRAPADVVAGHLSDEGDALLLRLPVRPCDARHHHNELQRVYRLDHMCPEPGGKDAHAIVGRRIGGERDRWDSRGSTGLRV
jgi:hypothetical protein